MKKLIILSIISLFAFTNCMLLTSRGRSVTVAEKNFKTGNYYESVKTLTAVLENYPSYQPAINLLNQSFSPALSTQIKKAEISKSMSNLEYAKSAEMVLDLFLMISKLKNETVKKLNFLIDYNQKNYWLNETSIAYYNAAESFINTPKTLNDFQKIALLYAKTYELTPNYKDVSLKYFEFKELGTRHIVYFIPNYNYNYFDFSSLIQTEFINQINKDASFMEFSKLYDGDKLNLNKNYNDLKNQGYNKIIEIDILKINYTKPSTRQSHLYKYYYEKKFKKNNIEITEIIDRKPDVIEGEITYIRKNYIQIENHIENNLNVIVKYRVLDLISGKILKESFIERNISDWSKWNTYLQHPTKVNESAKTLKDEYILLREVGSEIASTIGVEAKKVLY